jgi:hypothetical protein
MNAYETDLYEWTRTQADALRRRAANEIDWDNVAEEIESLGRNDRRQIEHRLENLILHLIKWKSLRLAKPQLAGRLDRRSSASG